MLYRRADHTTSVTISLFLPTEMDGKGEEPRRSARQEQRRSGGSSGEEKGQSSQGEEAVPPSSSRRKKKDKSRPSTEGGEVDSTSQGHLDAGEGGVMSSPTQKQVKFNLEQEQVDTQHQTTHETDLDATRPLPSGNNPSTPNMFLEDSMLSSPAVGGGEQAQMRNGAFSLQVYEEYHRGPNQSPQLSQDQELATFHAGLPKAWMYCFNSEKQRHLYINHETGQITWNPADIGLPVPLGQSSRK